MTYSKYQTAFFAHLMNSFRSLCLMALAGSGKTTSIVEAVRRFVLKSTDSIFITSFSTETISAMETKMKKVLGNARGELPKQVYVKGIHAFGYKALRDHFTRVRHWDVKGDKYTVLAKDMWRDMDYEDLTSIVDLADYARINNLRNGEITLAALQDIAVTYSLDIPKSESTVQLVKELIAEGLAEVRNGWIDFTDMLYVSVEKNLRVDTFSVVIVDEAQDLNAIQQELLSRALKAGGKFVAVGDPHQAIYMFAGALSDSMLKVETRFDSETLDLPVCYRCSKAVIREAQTIVPNIQAAENAIEGSVNHIDEATLKTMLLDAYKSRNTNLAVICRLTAPLVKLCLELLAMNIPAAVRGRDIAKQLVKTLKQISKYEDFKFAELPVFIDEWAEKTIASLTTRKNTEAAIQGIYDKAQALKVLFEGIQVSTLEQFISKINAMFSEKDAIITLMTAHRSKGLEYKRVFIIRPDKMPLAYPNQSAEQRQQEMNLRYVAITRAQEDLYWVHQKEMTNTPPPQGGVFDEVDKLMDKVDEGLKKIELQTHDTLLNSLLEPVPTVSYVLPAVATKQYRKVKPTKKPTKKGSK